MSRANLPIVICCILAVFWFGIRSGWAGHSTQSKEAFVWAHKSPEARIQAVITAASVPAADRTGWTSYSYWHTGTPKDAESAAKAKALIVTRLDAEVKAGKLLRYSITDLPTAGQYLVLRQDAPAEPAKEIAK